MASDKTHDGAKPKKHLHGGHRARVRKKFVEYGLESFSEIEVLEFLLFHVIPQKDTNETAHLLLDSFGSLKNVLNAQYDDLIRIEGMGDKSAAFIMFINEFYKYINSREFDNILLDTSKKVGTFCCNYFRHHRNECFIVIGMTHGRKIKFVEKISDGTEYETDVCKELVFKKVLNRNVKKIILAHNHPSSGPEPSIQDISVTNKVASMFKDFDIAVIDHVVCGENDFVSMSDRGMLDF